MKPYDERRSCIASLYSKINRQNEIKLPENFSPQSPPSFEPTAAPTSAAVDVIGSTVRRRDVTPVTLHTRDMQPASQGLALCTVHCSALRLWLNSLLYLDSR